MGGETAAAIIKRYLGCFVSPSFTPYHVFPFGFQVMTGGLLFSALCPPSEIQV